MRWNDELATEIAARYRAGESLRTLSRAYNVDRTTAWRHLRAAGVKTRPSGFQPGHKIGLGNTYGARRGGPLNITHDGYLGTRDRGGRRCYVHRGCWEAYRGPIPTGHIVHHIDGNTMNNDIGNLAQMPRGKHTTLHNKRPGALA